MFGELSFELIIKNFQGLLFKSIPMLYAPNIQQVRINSHKFRNKKGASFILAPFQKITQKTNYLTTINFLLTLNPFAVLILQIYIPAEN